jgi:type II secretory ATPase GspE/PulE/Tfp pilus assembly ATPase PilB-like protein
MGIAPFLLRSGILAIISQRLVRKLCDCSRTSDDARDKLGFALDQVRVSVGCAACHGTGYRGRFVLAEMLLAQPGRLGRAILTRSDAGRLERLAVRAGMITRWQRALDAVSAGLTSPHEVRRVLGFADSPLE